MSGMVGIVGDLEELVEGGTTEVGEVAEESLEGAEQETDTRHLVMICRHLPRE